MNEADDCSSHHFLLSEPSCHHSIVYLEVPDGYWKIEFPDFIAICSASHFDSMSIGAAEAVLLDNYDGLVLVQDCTFGIRESRLSRIGSTAGKVTTREDIVGICGCVHAPHRRCHLRV
jgi:hypothetical protein